jgi:hypothetical protein
MKTKRLFLAVALAAGLASIASTAIRAQAPTWNHKALVTFKRQTEIPGRILPPGQYVLKLVAPEIHVGQILSTDETQVFGIFFTKTTDRRSTPPLDTQVHLEPRQKGALQWDRLVAWFSPGEPVGDEVSYDKYQPVEPSR